jgi:DNA polymerase I
LEDILNENQIIEHAADKKTVFLIDGSGFLFRAYYGLQPLHSPQGIPVQAVYSFCRMIKKLLNRFDPSYISLVWDSKGPTIRHEIYQAYKAKRQEPPSDIFIQRDFIKRFADLIGMHQTERAGVEADDLLYSLASDYSAQNTQVIIVTSDKDLAQTLNKNTTIFDPFKDIFIDEVSFQKDMGFPVSKLPMYYGIVGDVSDNIPGVKGIGKKGATELVSQFESLEDLYKNIDKVKRERTRALLLEHKDNAFLSKKLFEAHYYPLHVPVANLKFDKNQWAQARPLFEELGFKSLLKELGPVPAEEIKRERLAERYNFEAVTTSKKLQEICSKIRELKLFACDTEGNGLDPLNSTMVGISICFQEGTAYYIPFGHTTGEKQLEKQEVFDALRPLLADPEIAKIMHHAKFDILMFHAAGLRVNNVAFDTILAANLVTQDWQSISLKKLSALYFDEPMLHYQNVVKENNYKNFSQVPIDMATEYAAADAHQTFKLYAVLEKELRTHHMARLYYEVEHPLLPVLADMQEQGIFMDVSILKKLDKEATRDLALIKEKAIALLGPGYESLNLNSPAQLKKVLFEDLKLEPKKKSRKGGKFSTDVSVLQELTHEHPLPGLILEYRELYKLKSTYIDALPEYINPRTGKIHSDFSQTAVATGRLASSDPNLQNIPTQTRYDIHIRSAFKPDKGHIFLSADYSQIELRVLAYLSQDRLLLESFEQDLDIHRQTAAGLFNIPLNEVTSQQREMGKRINFSILYGMTPYGLSQDLGIPFTQAKEFITAYFSHYPGVQAWMDTVIEDTKKHGYVTTLWERRRPVPAIYEANKILYSEACRIAINTRAQGTAAEIMKLSMISLHKKFSESSLKSKILLQIHDELLIMVPESEIDEAQQMVKDTMEHIVAWNVPLKVTTRMGADWYEVTK